MDYKRLNDTMNMYYTGFAESDNIDRKEAFNNFINSNRSIMNNLLSNLDSDLPSIDKDLELKIVTELPIFDNNILEDIKKEWTSYYVRVMDLELQISDSATIHTDDEEKVFSESNMDSVVNVPKKEISSLEEFLSLYRDNILIFNDVKKECRNIYNNMNEFLIRIEKLVSEEKYEYFLYQLCELFIEGLNILRRRVASLIVYKEELMDSIDD